MKSPIKTPLSRNQITGLIGGGAVIVAAAVIAIILIANKSDNPQTNKSSSTKASAPLGKEYADATTGLKITPPAGWTQVTPTPEGDIVDFQDNNQDFESSGNGRPTISVLTTQAQGSLAQYVSAISSVNAKNLKNYKSVAPQATTVDGQPAELLNYTATVNGHNLRNYQLLVIKGSSLYGVNGIALVSAWDKHQAEISASFATIKLP